MPNECPIFDKLGTQRNQPDLPPDKRKVTRSPLPGIESLPLYGIPDYLVRAMSCSTAAAAASASAMIWIGFMVITPFLTG